MAEAGGVSGNERHSQVVSGKRGELYINERQQNALS